MAIDLEKLKVQGTKMNYYFVCKRKLWLFSKGITMEQNNDRVFSGKLLHEKSYPRLKTRDVLIDDIINVDIIDGDFIREVKISSKMEKSTRMQLLYYLYYLKECGIDKKGLINYVKEKKQEVIELNDEYSTEVEQALQDINVILENAKPPQLQRLPYCTKCAYYEFCFVREE